jgi:acyl-CoA synthetase (AMP-forming)/AMP-acid ligase II
MLEFNTLVDVLCHRAQTQDDKSAFTFLNSELEPVQHLSFKTLRQQAARYAQALIEAGALNDGAQARALLVFSPGLDFVAAFFGCLMAGVVAIPVTAPRKNASWERLALVVSDSSAGFVLGEKEIFDDLDRRGAGCLTSLSWITPEHAADVDPAVFYGPVVKPGNLAMLQYTSGSTGQPRGVMLSHRQLMANSRAIAHAVNPTVSDIGMIWLPPHHDMGLIGGILQPVYVGIHCYLMSPSAFLQRPVRWLEAVSRYRATITAAPNFAYDLCVRRVSDEQLAQIDLSSVKVLLNGAEPIHAPTLAEFSRKFVKCGFAAEALMPCYGLAEATLLVSSRLRGQGLRQQAFSRSGLSVGAMMPAKENDPAVQLLVSAGRVDPDIDLLIVDPLSRVPCISGQVGEIWLRGETVGLGYWNNESATRETFAAMLGKSWHSTAADDNRPWLRTGDLGALHDQELWVTGRVKDVIIIRGQNHYPQDIENTVLQAHEALWQSMAVAFSVQLEDAEGLVVVVEVHRHVPPALLNDIENKVRAAVSLHHQLTLHRITFVRQASLPKTTSGKVQRRLTRSCWHHDTLNIVQRQSCRTEA